VWTHVASTLGVPAGDAPFGLLAVGVVLVRGRPLDRHDLERGEQQRGVEAAL
jgi:hypothetical protein